MSNATTTQVLDLQNYVGGGWHRSSATEYVDVANPATAEVLARTPLSTNADVECRGASRGRCFSRVAPHSAGRTRSVSVQAQESCSKNISTRLRA